MIVVSDTSPITSLACIALHYGINVSGVLGVLLEAKRKGLISTVKPLMDRLINDVEFRVGSQLYTIILQSAGE